MRDFLLTGSGKVREREPAPIDFTPHVKPLPKRSTRLCLFCRKPLGLKDTGHMHTRADRCVNSEGESRRDIYRGLGAQYG
jgi:hypothetical protein